MKNLPANHPVSPRFTRVFWLLGALWLAVVALSFAWTWRMENQNMIELARTEARSHCERDLIYREWATSHGGVYVLNVEANSTNTPAAANLMPEITTTTGHELMLIEPDTVLREVHELALKSQDSQSHVTSLKPSRPENTPDAWEVRAMRSFTDSNSEISSVEKIDGQPQVRLMRPMITAAQCLQCHEERGHKVGEVRGGISVSVPLSHYQNLTQTNITTSAIGHSGFALFGLASLWFARQRVARSLKARDRAIAAKRESENRYQRLYESMTDAFMLMSLEGKILETNQAFQKLLGYTETELLNFNYLRLIPEARQESEARTMQAQILAQEFSGTCENEFQKQNGTVFPAETRRFLLRNGNGSPTLIGVIIHDITERKQSEKALRESEERFRNMFQQIPSVAIQGYGPDGITQYWNEASERLYGYTAAEAVGRSLLDLIIPPEMRNDVTQAIKWMAETGQAIPAGELLLMRKDGSRVAVFSSHVLVKTTGQPNVLFCVDVDLTERKQAEAATASAKLQLERGLKFQQALLSAIPTPVFYKDRLGRYLGCNQAFTELTGATPEQLAGKTVKELWPSDYAATYHQADLDLIQNPRQQIYEYKVRDKHGADRDVIFAKNVFRNEDEQVAGIVGAFIDITERKQAEAALQQNEAHLKAVVSNLAECLFVTDANNRVTYLNPEAEKVFGFKLEDLRGKNLHAAIHHHHPDGRPYLASECKLACLHLSHDTIRQQEDVFFRQDGSPINVICSKMQIMLNGHITGSVLTVQDITEHRKLEQQFRQAQKMESIGQLAGGVAHDFNNILAAIQLQCGLFTMEPGITQAHIEIVREIEASSQRAANLTRQLLLFSRRQTMVTHDLNLNDVVANMTKMLQRIIGEDIAMQLKLAPGTLTIHADAGMIDQILLNLTVNARDAMPQGGQLKIETSLAEFDEIAAQKSPHARPGTFARLMISDTGCGIPAEILPRIFEPFFTTKEIGKGTGLGLATVFGIVQQHQGWINVTSEIGHGTAFNIYLPLLSKEFPTRQTLAGQAPLRRGQETILVAEDDPGVRASIKSILGQLGYRILEAASGDDALEIWRQHADEISLLLTDLVMPGSMNGKELAARLLQQKPKLKIIYSSGYSHDLGRKEPQTGSGIDFLPKPFQAHELAQMVRDRLDAS